jgi:hypothetical protein
MSHVLPRTAYAPGGTFLELASSGAAMRLQAVKIMPTAAKLLLALLSPAIVLVIVALFAVIIPSWSIPWLGIVTIVTYVVIIIYRLPYRMAFRDWMSSQSWYSRLYYFAAVALLAVLLDASYYQLTLSTIPWPTVATNTSVSMFVWSIFLFIVAPYRPV